MATATANAPRDVASGIIDAIQAARPLLRRAANNELVIRACMILGILVRFGSALGLLYVSLLYVRSLATAAVVSFLALSLPVIDVRIVRKWGELVLACASLLLEVRAAWNFVIENAKTTYTFATRPMGDLPQAQINALASTARPLPSGADDDTDDDDTDDDDDADDAVLLQPMPSVLLPTDAAAAAAAAESEEDDGGSPTHEHAE